MSGVELLDPVLREKSGCRLRRGAIRRVFLVGGVGPWKSRLRFRELHASIGCSPRAKCRRGSSCGPGNYSAAGR
jgi:hypothetical protein